MDLNEKNLFLSFSVDQGITAEGQMFKVLCGLVG